MTPTFWNGEEAKRVSSDTSLALFSKASAICWGSLCRTFGIVFDATISTISSSNTLSNIGNGSLTNSAITLAGTSVSLGGAFTAQNMLDAIKTVDGAGSGLDADLLDGNSSAYFRINIYDSAGTLLN